jgi:hypothetical protein
MQCNAVMDLASQARNEIDRRLQEDSKRYKECKILLLGPGDSGKSTVVKQMKIIHQGGFDERERTEYRTTIYKNVLDSAGTLARVVRRVGLGAFGEGREREYAIALLRSFPSVPGVPGDDSSVDDSSFTDDEVEVCVDPPPLTRVEERVYAHAHAHDERERRGIQTGRVSSRPTADVPTPVVDALAQTHATLTPALADAIWHVAKAPAVEKFVDEHSADFYLMDSAV